MLSWPDYFYTCVRRRKLLFHKPYDQGKRTVLLSITHKLSVECEVRR